MFRAGGCGDFRGMRLLRAFFGASIRDDGKRLRVYEEPIGVPSFMSEANNCEAGGESEGVRALGGGMTESGFEFTRSR